MGGVNQDNSGKIGSGGYLQETVSSPGFDLLVRAVPALAPPLVRALFSTCSVRIINRRVWEEYFVARRPYIGLMWHKDFLFSVDFFRRKHMAALVSRSKDGEIVSRTLNRVGFATVRGSSSTGGGQALLEFTRKIHEGWSGAIIADGPRGPARQAKMGAVIAAKESGVPLIPAGCDAEPAWRLRNWDRTMIPRPFSRIHVAFGEPIPVPPDATREDCERIRAGIDVRLEELNATCRRASAGG